MEYWNRCSVSSRLYAAFGLIGVIVLALASLSFLQQRDNDAVMSQVTQQEYQRMLQINAWQMVASTTTVRLIAINRSKDPALAQLFGPEIGPRIKEIEKHLAEISAWATSPEERALIKAIDTSAAPILRALGEIDAARKAGNDEAAIAAFDKVFMPSVTEYHSYIDKFAEEQQKKMSSSVAASQAQQWQRYWLGIGVIAALVVLTGLMVIILVRYIRRAMAHAIEVAESIRSGQLAMTVQGQGQDEFGALMRALDGMSDSLRQVVTQVRRGSESLSTASAEIAQGNNDLSARTEQQASALEQTAASMEELSSAVKQNADNARQANQLAQSASAVAIKGGEVVSEVVETMKGINDSSIKISDIISVIDGIAFQTNILALNAAVEAARAGEQGRGFAVVASEVRSLAGRSAEAAKEIKSLINASVERVEQGTALVDKAGETMTEVVSSIRRVTDIMGEISAASSEQSAGVAQVGDAVTSMDQTTQQNAALVEEMAAAASSLKTQANDLVQVVGVFKL